MPPTGADTPAEPATRHGAVEKASGAMAGGAWRASFVTEVCELDCGPLLAVAAPPCALDVAEPPVAEDELLLLAELFEVLVNVVVVVLVTGGGGGFFLH